MAEEKFKKEFIRVCNQRWIKGVNNGTNSVGLTFEEMMGKDADSMYFPDYFGMEIKCTTRFSRYPISLFSLAFEGPNLYETNRLVENYGMDDYKYANKKKIIGILNTKTPIKLSKYSFMLEICRRDRKMYLCIFDDNGNLIEKEAYVEFDTVINRLKLKLSNLIIVKASKKNIDGDFYFRFYEYKRYSLKKDIDFFNLIDGDVIKVCIMCRVSRSGEEEGRQRNKSLVFQIDKNKLSYLYDCVEVFGENN